MSPPTTIPAPLPTPPAAVPSAPPPWAPPVAATAYPSAPAATQMAAPPLTHPRMHPHLQLQPLASCPGRPRLAPLRRPWLPALHSQPLPLTRTPLRACNDGEGATDTRAVCARRAVALPLRLAALPHVVPRARSCSRSPQPTPAPPLFAGIGSPRAVPSRRLPRHPSCLCAAQRAVAFPLCLFPLPHVVPRARSCSCLPPAPLCRRRLPARRPQPQAPPTPEPSMRGVPPPSPASFPVPAATAARPPPRPTRPAPLRRPRLPARSPLPLPLAHAPSALEHDDGDGELLSAPSSLRPNSLFSDWGPPAPGAHKHRAALEGREEHEVCCGAGIAFGDCEKCGEGGLGGVRVGDTEEGRARGGGRWGSSVQFTWCGHLLNPECCSMKHIA
ncbi:hypothetical protein B0H14DRAFT_2592877 [Mycena olivaceomarginata]|nr:hypothetical protein B0H14DRAFT_2592877 [Mycena olivaceomarginata]